MKSRIAPVVIVLVAALLSTACNQQQGGQEPPTPTPVPTPIVPTKPTYKVQLGTVINQIQFTGRIGPVREEDLFFKVAGRVRNVNVQQGDVITAGEILADMEIDPLERQVAQAKLDLQRAQVSLQRAQKDSESTIAKAKIQLAMSENDYADISSQDLNPQLIQAQNALESAKLAVQQAQADYDRAPVAGRSGSWQAAALQRATLAFQNAQAAYDQVVAQITTGHQHDVTQAGYQVQLAKQALADAERGVNPLLQNDVAGAELALKTLQAQVTDAEVIAPFNGKVEAVRISPGSPADAFTGVIVVADPTALEIIADVDSSGLTNLKEGMTTTIALSDYPDKTMTGTIRQLPYPYGSGGKTTTDTSANAVQDTSTHITIDPKSAAGMNLVMGDLAKVTVVLQAKDNVLWLPPQAVRTFEGRNFVVIQEGDGQRRVDVTVGIQSTDRVEIKDGLKAGQVAVAP